MRSLRSVTAGGRDDALRVGALALDEFTRLYPRKLYWFLTHGYQPHAWQAAYHSADWNSLLARYRHLVAGRRGGKTLSAAWEVLFYCLHPEDFHQDAHGTTWDITQDEPLWVNILTADHEVGRPARMALLSVIRKAGLKHGRDYKWNKTEKTVEFYRGDGETITAFLQFRTAEDPQSLRGAGLDILWIDEAAFIRDEEAYNVIRPSLGDKLGIVITTTTPHGKNWFWERFFQGKPLNDDNHFRVEYTSIDNPFFRKEEWDEALATMHPAMFKQEHMAAFDAMSGLSLDGGWLHYYTVGTVMDGNAIPLPRDARKQISLVKYLGVDPSTGEGKDEFAICCIGMTEDRTQAFLLDYWTGKIPFPDQVDKIREWQLKYRPQLIGIEAQAYQRALSQQAMRLEGFPGIVPVIQPGGRGAVSKVQRLIAMSPLFKIGKIRIHKTHHQFVDQWVSFDAKAKENRDDLLDSVEIALSLAGVMLPSMATPELEKVNTLEQEAAAQVKQRKTKRGPDNFDIELGTEEWDWE